MTFPEHFRDLNVAIGPAGEPMDYIGLPDPWPATVPQPAPFEDLGTAGAIVVDGALVEVPDVGEYGYLVPTDWQPLP
jgi:hypothetical protein